MSNILIIKHGSLGDLIQANGAIEDIKNSFKKSKVLLLTSKNYLELMSQCPFLDGVIVDKRLPRWNLMYLIKLKKLLARYNFTHVFDLQNSKRTKFYRNHILKNSIWSSTETSLEPNETKKKFDKEPVLQRMKIQLNKSGISTNNINNINLKWALIDITRIIKQYVNEEYILIFPFCSKKHKDKKWPYYKELIKKIKTFYKNKYSILVIPGPEEIYEAQQLNAKVVLSQDNSVNLNTLITFINQAKFIVSNDTGPAHICSHLNKNGLALFGSHTSPDKVSIESPNFKTLKVDKLKNLSVLKVFEEIKKNLD